MKRHKVLHCCDSHERDSTDDRVQIYLFVVSPFEALQILNVSQRLSSDPRLIVDMKTPSLLLGITQRCLPLRKRIAPRLTPVLLRLTSTSIGLCRVCE